MEEEGPDAVKRNSDIDEENEIPRYLQKRRSSAEGRRILEFIESLKALEEELALEALAREGLEADGMSNIDLVGFYHYTQNIYNT